MDMLPKSASSFAHKILDIAPIDGSVSRVHDLPLERQNVFLAVVIERWYGLKRGGETLFPSARWKVSSIANEERVSLVIRKFADLANTSAEYLDVRAIASACISAPIIASIFGVLLTTGHKSRVPRRSSLTRWRLEFRGLATK